MLLSTPLRHIQGLEACRAGALGHVEVLGRQYSGSPQLASGVSWGVDLADIDVHSVRISRFAILCGGECGMIIPCSL